ncbi:SDR family NAD(P)-dependent oxidoreductase [Nocardia arthritidis]|nr:SDR family NAD(P)-dependent oxidoreductase [Nocardia arthritidis]
MNERRTAVVIGVGPGLGMSIAHRFGREGFAIALISRNPERHPGYIAALNDAGIEAKAYAADVLDMPRLRSALDTIGAIDVMYYGATAMDPALPKPITTIDADEVRRAMTWVYPAVDTVAHVLPGMLERRSGALLFAGGLSAVRPLPALGSLAIATGAMRNYAVTLHAALAEHDIYAGTLTIGGLVERGDIHRHVTAHPEQFGDPTGRTLDPDVIAETAWRLYRERDSAEAVFDALG